MKLPHSLRFVGVLVLLGAVASWSWNRGRKDVASAGTALVAPIPAKAAAGPADAPSVAGFDLPAGKPDDMLGSLETLRDKLLALPKDEAVRRIRDSIRTGDDRTTGLDFKIADDGSLAQWPTIRTFLIDVIASIDPAAAAALGREILATPTSADEWALALRNVAKGENLTQCAEFLLRKTEELLAVPAWQEQASAGYLNAVDVLVHVEATGSTPLLSGMVQRKDRRDLAHAGFLALDRLVQRQPAEMLTRLSDDPELQRSRPEMVAQQFARADVRDPAQRGLLKTWLLDPTRSPVELRSFASVYPNNNHFVSHNLLTRERSDSGADLAAHDREALQTISAWAVDPEFAPVHDYLELMVSRLEGFVSAQASPADPPLPR